MNVEPTSALVDFGLNEESKALLSQNKIVTIVDLIKSDKSIQEKFFVTAGDETATVIKEAISFLETKREAKKAKAKISVKAAANDVPQLHKETVHSSLVAPDFIVTACKKLGISTTTVLAWRIDEDANTITLAIEPGGKVTTSMEEA